MRSDENIPVPMVKEFLSSLVEAYPNENINIIWHGGEPLLRGIDFFNILIEHQKKISRNFKNDISTNLLLLNDEYIKLFKENNFKINTSLDGIGARHDFQRDRSFDFVFKQLEKLKSSGIKEVSINTTITKYNVNELEEIYNLCSSLKYIWEFSLVVPAGIKKTHTKNILVDPIDFSLSIIKIFNKWFMSELAIEIPIFQNIINYIVKSDDYLQDNKAPISLGPDGHIYRCPLFIGDSKYSLGNFTNDSFGKRLNCSSCSDKVVLCKDCANCHFALFCKIVHCDYLLGVQNNTYQGFLYYLCNCWKPVYYHILKNVISELQNN